jgi:hypothetical protein
MTSRSSSLSASRSPGSTAARIDLAAGGVRVKGKGRDVVEHAGLLCCCRLTIEHIPGAFAKDAHLVLSRAVEARDTTHSR